MSLTAVSSGVGDAGSGSVTTGGLAVSKLLGERISARTSWIRASMAGFAPGVDVGWTVGAGVGARLCARGAGSDLDVAPKEQPVKNRKPPATKIAEVVAKSCFCRMFTAHQVGLELTRPIGLYLCRRPTI